MSYEPLKVNAFCCISLYMAVHLLLCLLLSAKCCVLFGLPSAQFAVGFVPDCPTQRKYYRIKCRMTRPISHPTDSMVLSLQILFPVLRNGAPVLYKVGLHAQDAFFFHAFPCSTPLPIFFLFFFSHLRAAFLHLLRRCMFAECATGSARGMRIYHHFIVLFNKVPA